MIYVFSDGSLSSSSMVDNSTAGRGKLGWQGDNQSVASTFFLVYSPNGRPRAAQRRRRASRSATSPPMARWSSTSSPAANSVYQLVETVVLNYMALHGNGRPVRHAFPMNSLGSAAQGLAAFAPIV